MDVCSCSWLSDTGTECRDDMTGLHFPGSTQFSSFHRLIRVFNIFRLTHDISLEEFEDEDLSEITEITDERGLSLNCNGLDIKVRENLTVICLVT